MGVYGASSRDSISISSSEGIADIAAESSVMVDVRRFSELGSGIVAFTSSSGSAPQSEEDEDIGGDGGGLLMTLKALETWRDRGVMFDMIAKCYLNIDISIWLINRGFRGGEEIYGRC